MLSAATVTGHPTNDVGTHDDAAQFDAQILGTIDAIRSGLVIQSFSPTLPQHYTMTTTATRPPTTGESAPDFTLASTAGTQVTLSSFRGETNVLLAFFPLAFTGVCTAEMCAFSEDFDAFTSADVQVLPISVDAVPSLKEFKNKFALKVDLLSDFRRDASRAFGVLREDTFFSNRAYFLIDKAGVVRWTHVEDTPVQRRENAELLEAIKSLTH